MNEQTELERLKAIEARLTDEWQRLAFLKRITLTRRHGNRELLHDYRLEQAAITHFLGYTPVEDMSDWIPPILRPTESATP